MPLCCYVIARLALLDVVELRKQLLYLHRAECALLDIVHLVVRVYQTLVARHMHITIHVGCVPVDTTYKLEIFVLPHLLHHAMLIQMEAAAAQMVAAAAQGITAFRQIRHLFGVISVVSLIFFSQVMK